MIRAARSVEDAENDGQAESVPTSASTEAGKVSTVDEKGPKACAADEPAASTDGKPDGDG